MAFSQLRLATALLASGLLFACASRGSVEQVQLTTETQFNDQNSKIDGIAAKQKELSEKFDAILAQLEADQAARQKVAGDVNRGVQLLSNYENDFNALRERVAAARTEFGRRIDDLDARQENTQTDLTQSKATLSTSIETVNRDLVSARTDLGTRIGNSNSDITNLRQQSRDKFADLSNAVTALGKGLVEILRLQRDQFQSATERYETSIGDINAVLPETTLSTLKPDELLKTTNPDAQQPNAAP